MPDRVPTLAAARRAVGLSQRQIADYLGVSQRTISQLEHGEFATVTTELVDRYLAHLQDLGSHASPQAAGSPPRLPTRDHAG
jgi:transcriptional regulator with XRE-family HTH domain